MLNTETQINAFLAWAKDLGVNFTKFEVRRAVKATALPPDERPAKTWRLLFGLFLEENNH